MRFVARIALLALALALLGLALTPKASPAQVAGPCSPDRPVPHWWYFRPEQPCEGDSVTVVFGSCRECVDLTGYSWSRVSGLVIEAGMPVECPAIDMCTFDSLEVPLGRFAAGFHQLPVLVSAAVADSDSVLCTIDHRDTLAFAVGCPPPPPPPPPPDSLLPFVNRILIGAPPPCIECPPVICPFLPIPLRLAGEFPSFCYQFEKLELLPSPIMGPRPEPPVVRLTVSRRACAPCALALEPWSADTLLPGLPWGTYDLMFQLRLVSMCSSFMAETTYFATRRFTVLDSCQVTPPGPCVWADWVHMSGRCDDFIVPGGRAKATMTITSSVPLAGLEGQLSLWPPGLLITNLEPVGPAQGMRIAWQRTQSGAKFLMFAESGAPIGGLRIYEPVLAVSMVKDTDAVLAPVTHLSVAELLGADSLGRAVPECNILTFGFAPVEARICSGPTCDFNLDGRLDVRDLVVMVHCILGTGPCPDTTSAGLDCNGDGRLGVDDVLCCARVILHGGERDTVPGRPEPGVAVELGAPAWSAEGLEVPLALARADRVGAARLVLDYPSDRYEVTGVELVQPASEWLVVHEVVEGKLVVGVIGLGAGAGAGGDEAPTLGLRLRLKAKLGASGGGEVTVVDQQFSGRDGVTLEVPVNGGAVTLPEAGRLGLSGARPNPFAEETRFGLNLERGAEAEVAIYDLSGRRVATLHQGALSAGPHEFRWRGERSDGSRAHAGIYFVQARVGSEKLTRKVVLLRGD
jgi:hypothetical protein